MEMKKLLIAGLVSSSLILVGCQSNNTTTTTSNDANTEQQAAVAEFKEISGDELNKIVQDKKLKEKYLVIDVRPEDEYNAGHVKWAINKLSDDIVAGDLSGIDHLDKSFPIITVCNTGNRSAKSAQALVDAGFTEVYNAEGVKDYEYETITQVGFLLAPELQEIANAGDDKYFIIDARKPEDFEKGHLKGAVNITRDEIQDRLDEVPKDKTVVAYCYSGNQSLDVVEALVADGHEDVWNANDGTKEYDGFELVTE